MNYEKKQRKRRDKKCRIGPKARHEKMKELFVSHALVKHPSEESKSDQKFYMVGQSEL